MEFAIFSIENIAEKTHIASEQVYHTLKQSGILDNYIIPSYDSLHTQSKDYIVSDILEVMKENSIL